MGKTAKPWLNYKSNEEDVTLPKRKHKTKRSYKKALIMLILFGFGGGHKFYLYDEKRAWRILGVYFVVIITASLLKPFLELAPLIAFICYASSIIYSAYPSLKHDVERVNQEIQND